MTREDLLEALRDVEDPEFCISVVDMGLIVDVAEADGRVQVDLTFTAMGCPATDMIMDDIRERLMEKPEVSAVDINVVWDPVWTSDRLSDEGRFALQSMGVAV